MSKALNRSIKFLFVFFACLIVFVIPVKAGDFDANYYAEKYPDVVAVYGTNPANLYDHYLNYGRAEHRFKNAEEEQNGISSDNLDTYVDVDIANQTMTYYVNGEIAIQSPCVTGTPGGNSTPKGNFVIKTKIPGKYLVGPTWNVWVDRWMRFTGNCGLHDASWRSKFGGNIYKTDGSHGCVNLPKDVAYQLYDSVDIGTAVIVH